ncbi:MAG: hypothetical protein IT453_01520 [Planctomycetes bacterium]|nr:hypothetical protein [Planctomycetota bacterium]
MEVAQGTGLSNWVRAALALGALAPAIAAYQSPAPSAPIQQPAPLTLAEARAAFAKADADQDAVLEAGEFAAAALGDADVKLADRDADGVLRSEEYLGALPLLLARAGRRASPELESEAIRLRALGAPTPARSASTAPAPASTGGAARERLVSAVRGPVEPPQATRPRSSTPVEGPAGARLRTAPTAAEAEARLQAARVALSERLQHASGAGEPASAPTEIDTVSGQRRRAQDDERNDPSITAQRLRAARQKLDERIRGARDEGARDGQTRPAETVAPERAPAPGVPKSAPPRPRADTPAETSGGSSPQHGERPMPRPPPTEPAKGPPPAETKPPGAR